ncbi:uncharacterized protein GLRG_01183 [Colletotrichum graminicola M1.001]|uniref:Uncharacterized protein n=1 Tax=Colletotrichum graminicola (strain M1.001 / M2 / FGSC 10212) TaxID=645133 RepID=E3Q4M4_COLGM|nr:uncharacterized protein GLRG_01183 [Colletotrichum graminicola M1.001]EFQ26039.1 hypothetical protein GLRG_01183 [Colletotrichum graminicola M1.001]
MALRRLEDPADAELNFNKYGFIDETEQQERLHECITYCVDRVNHSTICNRVKRFGAATDWIWCFVWLSQEHHSAAANNSVINFLGVSRRNLPIRGIEEFVQDELDHLHLRPYNMDEVFDIEPIGYSTIFPHRYRERRPRQLLQDTDLANLRALLVANPDRATAIMRYFCDDCVTFRRHLAQARPQRNRCGIYRCLMEDVKGDNWYQVHLYWVESHGMTLD